jgi:hypothetical protein
MISYLHPYNEKDVTYIVKYGIYRYLVNILINYDILINEEIFKRYDIIIIIENPYIRFMNNIINTKTMEHIKNVQHLNIYEFLCLIPSQTCYYNIKNNYYYTYKFIIDKNNITIIDHTNTTKSIEDIQLKYKPIIEEIKNENNTSKFYEKYNQELLDFVNKIYSDDFETFGYKKCETLEELLKYYIQ